MNLLPTLVVLLHIVGNSFAFTMPKNKTTRKATSQLMQSAGEENIGNKYGDRRKFMDIISSAVVIGSTSTFFPLPSLAAEDDAFTVYKDENIGFQIKAPSGWDKSEQTLPDRRRLVLFINNEDGSATNKNDLMFIAYTPIRDDFTYVYLLSMILAIMIFTFYLKIFLFCCCHTKELCHLWVPSTK